MARRLVYWSVSIVVSLIVGIGLSACFNFFVPFLVVLSAFCSVGMNACEDVLGCDEDSFGTTLTAILPPVFVILVAITILVNPQIVYKDVHSFWLIFTPILSVMFTTLFKPMYLGEESIFDVTAGVLSIILHIVGIIGIIVVIIISKNNVYHITDASDMHLIANAPQNSNTVFIIENDIDFAGEDTRWFGRRRKFKGTLDGEEHTLSNIELNYQSDTWKINRAKKLGYKRQGVKRSFGMVKRNLGTIKNINFEDCSINLECSKSKVSVSLTSSYQERSGTVLNCNAHNCYLEWKSHKYRLGAGPSNSIVDSSNSLLYEGYYYYN